MSSRRLAKVLLIGQTFLLGKVQWIKMSGAEKTAVKYDIQHYRISKKLIHLTLQKNIFDEKKLLLFLRQR